MRSSPSAFTNEVKELIAMRSNFACDRCGLRVIEGGQAHHRLPRRAGGSRDAELGQASNGLWLHPGCHDFIESKRKIAAQLGLIVGYGARPVEVPVLLWAGWFMLNDDGTKTRLSVPPPLSPQPGPVPGEELT